MRNSSAWLTFLALGFVSALVCSCRKQIVSENWPEVAPGVAVTNLLVAEKPWSIFVARIERNGHFELRSTHANRSALGLTTLTDQIRDSQTNGAVPIAGLNGDFYQRERAYAGDPRGLQIVDGELISAPGGTASLWIDAAGTPHIARVQPAFTIHFADGANLSFGLNEERHHTNAVLFTPVLGSSTKTTNGTELVLERDGTNAWLPLRIGESIPARVRAIREGGDTPLTSNVIVISLGPDVPRRRYETGAVVTLSTASKPDLRGARAAISGGPILVSGGRVQKIDPTGLFDPNSYAAKSMAEEHPRSAIGWNDKYFFLVEVDGRQKSSIGMTLEDLAKQMVKLGCTEAMNLDGGGSSTLWCNGAVVNKPCDGRERPIANALVVTRKASVNKP